MNIFEGARRIALLIAAIGGLAGLAAAYEATPSVTLKYRVAYYGVPAIISEDCTGGEDGTAYAARQLPRGGAYTLSACFAASPASDGSMLIPYAEGADGKSYVMNGKYDDEVRTYMQQMASTGIKPAASELESVSSQLAWQRVTKPLGVLGYTVLSLFGFWAFVAALGWIARGFAGIPSGLDHRPAKAPSVT